MEKEFSAAMGNEDGDYLIFENKWHKVSIEIENGRFRFLGEVDKHYDTIGEALEAVWKELALYEQGRA